MQNVEIDIHEVKVFLSELEASFDATDLMGEIGAYLNFSIKDRTSRGEDYKGRSFKPYSPSYKRVREKKDLPTDHVDLFFRGHMLGAMNWEASRDEVRMFFMDTTDKSGVSAPAKAFYNDETRPFFSISSEERETIMKMVEEYFNNVK